MQCCLSHPLVGGVNVKSLCQQIGLFVLTRVNTNLELHDSGIELCLYNLNIIFIHIFYLYITAILLLLFNIFEKIRRAFSIKPYRDKGDVI